MITKYNDTKKWKGCHGACGGWGRGSGAFKFQVHLTIFLFGIPISGKMFEITTTRKVKVGQIQNLVSSWQVKGSHAGKFIEPSMNVKYLVDVALVTCFL